MAAGAYECSLSLPVERWASSLQGKNDFLLFKKLIKENKGDYGKEIYVAQKPKMFIKKTY